MNTISNPILNCNLRHSSTRTHSKVSQKRLGIYGDMRVDARRFVRLQPHVLTLLIAPTIQSHDVWGLWQDWEVGRIESSLRTQMPRQEPKLLQRVDAMFLERMRQIYIGPSLVYPALGAVPNTTIDYTAAGDSHSTFVTFPPQQFERKLSQVTKVREPALHMLSWKDLS
jgi:hypothetical protein